MIQSIRVGDIVVQPVYDGIAVLKPTMWPGSDWTDHQHLLDDDGDLVVPVGGFLVRVAGRLLLIDTGVGDVHDSMFDAGALLQSLASLGVQPGDIDTVILSHLHRDHMGWVERDAEPTFPKATVHIGAADWEHFVETPDARPKVVARLRAIENRVSLVDRDDVTILPGVTTRATPGHTPGHTSIVVSSGDERLILLGDALHCPAQLTETEWQFIADVDPELAIRTRQALLREAEDASTTLLPCHFPGMQAARLLSGHGTRRWVLGGQSSPA